jgi:DNA-binding response OmpR family regulator
MDDLKRILVVDDEEDLTWSISKSLEKNDKVFEVICVNNGDSALAYLATRQVDLVITDVRMPGRDGLALLREIERNFPRTRVIIMTAHGSEETRRQIALRGLKSYYLEKPFELHYLRKLIYDALEVTEVGFAGTFDKPDFPLEFQEKNRGIRDMIEHNCQNGHTSALRVFNGNHSGVIHFNRGEIVHAECGELIGENALFNMLDWEKGNFAADPQGVSNQRTIQTGWQTLLNIE